MPAGNTAAVYTLSTGWINDMYAGNTPDTAEYGFYAGANQAIIMGPTAAIALPTPVANQLSLGNKIVTSLIDAVGGIFGFSILPDPVNTGSNGLTAVSTPPLSTASPASGPARPPWTSRAARTDTPHRPTGTSRRRPTAPWRPTV